MALVRNATLGIINAGSIMIAPGATAQVDEKETGTLIKRGKLVRVREGDRTDPETETVAATPDAQKEPVKAPDAPKDDDDEPKRSNRRA